MSEAEAAASYWSQRKLGAFSRERPWSQALAVQVAMQLPGRRGAGCAILEFGCNVGRHMHAMRQQLPEAAVTGIDIHLPAVQEARRTGLYVLLGDEFTLGLLPPDTYDVAYTVSVLDHLPDPQQALERLDRIARVLMFVEPWLGSEQQLQDRGTSPWTYSWDYEARLPRRQWKRQPFPLHQTGAGPHYQLHTGT